jgi:hypothetical protein
MRTTSERKSKNGRWNHGSSTKNKSVRHHGCAHVMLVLGDFVCSYQKSDARCRPSAHLYLVARLATRVNDARCPLHTQHSALSSVQPPRVKCVNFVAFVVARSMPRFTSSHCNHRLRYPSIRTTLYIRSLRLGALRMMLSTRRSNCTN